MCLELLLEILILCRLDDAVFRRYGLVKKCAVKKHPKSEIDRYQAA